MELVDCRVAGMAGRERGMKILVRNDRLRFGGGDELLVGDHPGVVGIRDSLTKVLFAILPAHVVVNLHVAA